MAVDPAVIVIVALILILALVLYFGGNRIAGGGRNREAEKTEAQRREARAHQERLEQERQERYEEARKEEAGAMEGARKRMAFAQENIHQVQQEFQQHHDQLIADIHLQAKAGCDALFQQRFGITRPPKAANPEYDPEVQEFLRQHYAELRDVALADSIEGFIDAEARRRIEAEREAAAADEEATSATEQVNEDGAEAPSSQEPEPTPEPNDETTADEAAAPDTAAECESVASADETDAPKLEAEDEAEASETEGEGEAETPEPETEGEAEASDLEADSEDENASDTSDESDGKAAPNADATDEPGENDADESDAVLEALRETVRDEMDIDSVRTYLLAAISARYDADNRPLGDLPWPAFTSISTRGYGELVLAEGAPVYAQDSYREFAWKKFHTGRRSEKPTRGEYSWPASHELGDGIPVESVPTPAGIFTAEGPKGTLPLYELFDCSWMRHSLEYQGALLEPDGQRSFFINLEGLRKGDELLLHFDKQEFLEEAEDGPYFLNAIGEVNGAYVGISASKPEAANLGEAPYKLVERTPAGFVFRMTYDARRHDVDTYPQFLEVHLAWCQPPAPRPDRIIRHVAN